MANIEYLLFDVILVQEMKYILLVEYKGKQFWFPKSRIKYEEGAEIGDKIEILVPIQLTKGRDLI